MNNQKEIGFNFFKKDILKEKHKTFHMVSVSMFLLTLVSFVIFKLMPNNLIGNTKLINQGFSLLFLLFGSLSSISLWLKGIFHLNKYREEKKY